MTPVVTLDRDQPLLPEPPVHDELVTDVAGDLPNPTDARRWAIQYGWSDEQAAGWEAYLRRVELQRFLRTGTRDGRLAGDTEAER